MIKLASISRYVRDYGNKTFFEEPFNEIDNVVFSSLIYLNYEGIVPENRKYIRLEEAGIKYLEKYSYFCPSTNKLTKWNNRITNHSLLRKGFRHLQALLSLVLIYISTLERLESENPRTKDDILCLYYRSYYICAVFTEKNDIMA